MAKQIEDTRTAELPLPDAPRRRGRPATGKAMTPAERKRAQRARDAEALRGEGVVYREAITRLTLDALSREMAQVSRLGYLSLVDACYQEFRSRAEMASRAKST